MSDAPHKHEAFAAHRHGDLGAAERLYRELLRAHPEDAELHHYLGVLCHQTGRAVESAQWLRSAAALAPASIPTWQLLIRVCDAMGDAAGALAALDRYLALSPNDAGMLNVKGQQLTRLERLRDAEAAFRRAAEISGNAGMFHDLGLCRRLLGDLPGAASAFHAAVQRGHTQPRTYLWLAQCLRAMGKTKDYYDVVTQASAAAPRDLELLIEAQSARRYVCDWDGFESQQPQLIAGLKQVLAHDGAQDIPPGILNYLDIDETTIAAVARRYAKQLTAAGRSLLDRPHDAASNRTRGKIRLGYLSTDFFTHAVGTLVRDLFASHDRSRFEVYGYSLRHQPDAVQACIQRGCDAYRDLSGSSAARIAQTIADDGIDILIDLAGYTSAAQPIALAARPAPIQISWLGYLGTSGGDFMDYLIADDTALPTELARHYAERIIRLPHFMVASPLPVTERPPAREAMGLEGAGFVFCSFNQPYKLDRATFEAWMDILNQVPGSRLWLYAPDSDICTANLRAFAARRDVAPERLTFATAAPMPEHIARLSCAGLALDPFHISGGATSVASLAAGLPVLTLRGQTFLARMGSSINKHLGLAELDCLDREQYVTQAVALATNPAMLATLKERLASALTTHGFFDTRRFARTFEEALRIIWDRHTAGAPPDDARVSART
ncbi:MAG: tetratricopeptide repeat protein [Gammaproteobacteria bacterium]|nr:tetratricopeptide repeat protein [Gammaproteobacteria bacterium]